LDLGVGAGGFGLTVNSISMRPMLDCLVSQASCGALVIAKRARSQALPRDLWEIVATDCCRHTTPHVTNM